MYYSVTKNSVRKKIRQFMDSHRAVLVESIDEVILRESYVFRLVEKAVLESVFAVSGLQKANCGICPVWGGREWMK